MISLSPSCVYAWCALGLSPQVPVCLSSVNNPSVAAEHPVEYLFCPAQLFGSAPFACMYATLLSLCHNIAIDHYCQTILQPIKGFWSVWHDVSSINLPLKFSYIHSLFRWVCDLGYHKIFSKFSSHFHENQ